MNNKQTKEKLITIADIRQREKTPLIINFVIKPNSDVLEMLNGCGRRKNETN